MRGARSCFQAFQIAPASNIGSFEASGADIERKGDGVGGGCRED
jgi:hypothetical protein